MLILDNLISVIFVIFARVGLVADPDLMDRVGDQMHVGECVLVGDPDLLDMGLVGDVCDPDACTVHLVSSRPGSASSACTSSSSGGRAVSPPGFTPPATSQVLKACCRTLGTSWQSWGVRDMARHTCLVKRRCRNRTGL